MPKLPLLKPAEVARVLRSAGFVLIHQKGSHAYYRKEQRLVTVAMHPDTLKKGTLNAIVKQSGLDPSAFFKGKDRSL